MISLKNNNSIHLVLLKDFYEISLLLLPFRYKSPQNFKSQYFIPMILQFFSVPPPFIRHAWASMCSGTGFYHVAQVNLWPSYPPAWVSAAGIIVAPSCWPEVDLVIYYLSYTLSWRHFFEKKSCINYVKSSFSGKVFLMFLESFLSPLLSIAVKRQYEPGTL